MQITANNKTPATMACRRRRLLLGVFLFLRLISHLLVVSSIFNTVLSKSSLKLLWFLWSEGRPDSSDVWNLRAVIDSIFLSAPLLFCLVLFCSFCLVLVSAFDPVSCLLSRNVFKLFSR